MDQEFQYPGDDRVFRLFGRYQFAAVCPLSFWPYQKLLLVAGIPDFTGDIGIGNITCAIDSQYIRLNRFESVVLRALLKPPSYLWISIEVRKSSQQLMPSTKAIPAHAEFHRGEASDYACNLQDGCPCGSP